jgi:hypothetical protein
MVISMDSDGRLTDSMAVGYADAACAETAVAAARWELPSGPVPRQGYQVEDADNLMSESSRPAVHSKGRHLSARRSATEEKAQRSTFAKATTDKQVAAPFSASPVRRRLACPP